MKKTQKRKISLSSLTTAALSITVSLAVIISLTCFIGVYSDTVMKDAQLSSAQSVSQTAVTVGNYLGEMKAKLNLVSEEISKSKTGEEVSERISNVSRLHDDIEAIMVYDADGNILFCGSNGKTLKENIKENLSFDKELSDRSDAYAVSMPHVETLFKEYYPWVVTVYHRDTLPLYGDIRIAVDFSFSEIAKYIDNISIGQHGYSYIIDKRGSVVYHPQQQMVFAGIGEDSFTEVSTFKDGSTVGKDVIYTLQTISNSSWRIVGVSYTEDIAASRTQVILAIILFSVICYAAIALLTVMIFSKTVTNPINRLVFAMKEFEISADRYRYTPEDGRISEIQTLSDSFGHMVTMIQELMEKVRREEISLRKTELKALQAQINPHFLYNTLDSIQWMCEQGKTEEAVKMVGALAKLFRISISRGKELITMRDEIKHAESYLIIQSFRYKNQFSYSFDVDESLLDCLCNKITIQPLIENAIYHGIDRMIDEGRITVDIHSDKNGDILIKVADNGVGMTEEQCRNILKKERSDSSGIGIKNVNDRLKIYFGDDYGIEIESELDVGTTVTVKIPQIRKEPDNEI